MTHARARLLLGISGVGCIVALSVTALLPIFHIDISPTLQFFQVLQFPLALYTLISFPFDLFGATCCLVGTIVQLGSLLHFQSHGSAECLFKPH